MTFAFWQIAKREYWSYVATWGFWLSLALIPLFMSIGVVFPLLADRSEPIRYVSVIADNARFEAAVADRILEQQKNAARSAVLGIVRVQGTSSLTEAEVRAIFDEAKDWSEARAALEQQADPAIQNAISALGAFTGKLRLVDAPARDAEAIRPFLLGEAMIDTPQGPRPLHAAAFIREEGNEVFVDYWSREITSNDARVLIDAAVREQMRQDRLAELGLTEKDADLLLNARPKVEEYSPERARESAKVSAADRAPYLAAIAMGLVLWTAIFSIANMLLSSTVEEKANKILDSLLATVRLNDILFGKLTGVAMVSATLLAIWGLVGVGGLTTAQQAASGNMKLFVEAFLDWQLLIPFLCYFVFGYLIYGAAFIAIGSLCDSLHEAQTLLTPIIFFLMGPILAIVFALRNPDGLLIKIMSWFPFYTPFIMPLRLPTGVSTFEIVVTSLAMVATTAVIVHLAAKVFRAGAVSGATPATLLRVASLRKKAVER
jgi:ABC-2 type transport system permease protein